MSVGAIIGIIVGVVVLILLIILIWWVSTHNNFKRMSIKIDEANSGIDVALTKRYDLLTKSIATVKGYAKHESETLEKVLKMRQPASNASMAEKSAFNEKLSEVSKSINVVMENYPNLHADSHFLELQRQMQDVEEQLQAARRLYNSNVTTFNNSVVVWPSNIIAKKYGYEKKEFFIAEAYKREDVKVEF